MTLPQNIGQIKPSELSEIVGQHMIGLSVTWAKLYNADGKTFIECFKKYRSIRTAAAFIVQSYKWGKIFDECKKKDFTEYANRVCPDHARLLNDLLIIIYSITCNG